jgi:hypothetical protein
MFRFTIRDVLWLTVVVALVLCLAQQWRRANLWEARAEYIRKYFREEFGVESLWDKDDAGFTWVEGHPNSGDLDALKWKETASQQNRRMAGEPNP